MLSDIPAQIDDRVLVDFRTADDAGVYRWESGPALVQTVDFFTPIVDDPYVYGQIAAANSLSDVYAMGGTPVTALAIAAFPQDDFEPETIRAIFMGGFDKLREGGVALLGGHTVRDPEIKFGYAVTGAIDPARVLTNAGAKAGDVLFLTKPLGTGIVGTAIKFERAPDALASEATQSMLMLNRAAADALRTLPAGAVHACTDVTGFGLIGHLGEMLAASLAAAELDPAAVPLYPGALALAQAGISSTLLPENLTLTSLLRGEVDAPLRTLLFDPQTSGGLLAGVHSDRAEACAAALRAGGYVHAAIMGRVSGAVGSVRDVSIAVGRGST